MNTEWESSSDKVKDSELTHNPPPKESPILGEILVAIVFGHEIHIFIPTTLAVHSGVSTASLNTYNVI